MSHRDELVGLALERGWTRGAALGLGTGLLFEMLLSRVPELHMLGVDHFLRPERRARVVTVADRFYGRCMLLVMKTVEAAPLVPNGSLDFELVEAGHTYGCVRADIRAWWPKVRAGGWFGGHDYNANHAGVVRAVDERFGPMVRVSANSVWSVEKY